MNTKTLIMLTLLLAAAILAILFFTQQSLRKTAAVLEENVIEETLPPQESAPAEGAAAKRLAQQGAITIIETARREDKNSRGEPQKENGTKRTKQPSSIQNSPSDAGTPKPPAAAGITVINKEPTPAEKKEMESRGIMIY